MAGGSTAGHVAASRTRRQHAGWGSSCRWCGAAISSSCSAVLSRLQW